MLTVCCTQQTTAKQIVKFYVIYIINGIGNKSTIKMSNFMFNMRYSFVSIHSPLQIVDYLMADTLNT